MAPKKAVQKQVDSESESSGEEMKVPSPKKEKTTRSLTKPSKYTKKDAVSDDNVSKSKAKKDKSSEEPAKNFNEDNTTAVSNEQTKPAKYTNTKSEKWEDMVEDEFDTQSDDEFVQERNKICVELKNDVNAESIKDAGAKYSSSTSIINFNYAQYLEMKTPVDQLSVDDLLKRLIAMTHATKQHLLCKTLKQTLKAKNSECNYPGTRSDPTYDRDDRSTKDKDSKGKHFTRAAGGPYEHFTHSTGGMNERYGKSKIDQVGSPTTGSTEYVDVRRPNQSYRGSYRGGGGGFRGGRGKSERDTRKYE
jgi:hypothetical protein